MPPYFIFPGKRVPVTFNRSEGGVEGSIFSMMETGYMDTQTFYMWFDLETFQQAQKNGICLYALLKTRLSSFNLLMLVSSDP